MDLIVPPLLILATFGIIFAVGVGLIYIVLLIYDREARKCPKCHRRGAGSVTHTDEIHSRTFIDQAMMSSMARTDKKWVKPLRITETIYEDQFECKYCHHTWSKTVTERQHNPS